MTSDVEFILTNTDRLITVTFRCVISFGRVRCASDAIASTNPATKWTGEASFIRVLGSIKGRRQLRGVSIA